jgi:signal transduction histidine kinase
MDDLPQARIPMNQFERRLYLGIIIIVIGFVPIILGSFFALHHIVHEQKDVVSTNVQKLLLAERLRYIDSIESSLMPIYVLTGESSVIKDFEIRNRQFDDLAMQLLDAEQAEGGRDQTRVLISEIRRLSKSLRAFSSPGIQLRQSGASLELVNQYFDQNTGPLVGDLQEHLRVLVNDEAAELDAAKRHVATTVNWTIAGLSLLSFFALALVVLIGRLLSKIISQKRSFDETQQELFENERHLSLARKETVEVVSHDLKNPLSTIKMSLELMFELINEPVTPQNFQDFEEGLQIAKRSADSMERLIKDLLDHAKIEAGHLDLERKENDLAAMVSDLVLRFKPLAKNKGISLLNSTGGAKLVANCDPGRIEQVLSNLLGNALKFTPDAGQITIDARIQGSGILITVADTGAGISPTDIGHIFDRFWQVRATSRNGTGLGLAISKAIVEAHGGEIKVESEIGKGSKFAILLPMKQNDKSIYPAVESLSEKFQPEINL